MLFRSSIIKYIGIIAAVIAFVLIWSQRDIKSTYIKWHEAQVLYTQKKYKEASVIYVDLSKKLSHQSDFIYEAADCFYNISSYQISTDFLNRGLSYSSKSKLYHLMAKNKIMQGKYEEAEQHLIEAIQILPYSGENYYELIKFYSYPHSLNYEKLNQAVLTFNQIKKLENNNITYNMILDVYEICYRTNVPFSLYFENSDLNEQN